MVPEIQEFFDKIVELLFGSTNIESFREDLNEVIPVSIDESQVSKGELVKEVESSYQAAEKHHRNVGLLIRLFLISASFLAFIVEILDPRALLLIASILVFFEFPLRQAIIRRTGFNSASQDSSLFELRYRRAWNKVLKNTISISLILIAVGLLKYGKESWYNTMIDTVEMKMKEMDQDMNYS